jgi:hypothetical protein
MIIESKQAGKVSGSSVPDIIHIKVRIIPVIPIEMTSQ